ncbi:hypothetical protein ACOCLD_14985 [Pseudomonas sp. MAC6]|uniref:hypothetical protein n=1 Tax=Pseudomonas sp. MAC6 TaxID=3401633 RepID=UPI003BF591D6
MAAYFVHNGFCGWSYGTPSDPQLISFEDAAKIMQQAKLSSEQVKQTIPPAQYATEADDLYYLTGKKDSYALATFTNVQTSTLRKSIQHYMLSGEFPNNWFKSLASLTGTG